MSDDQFDRVPPQDIDAEMSVLGSMMLTTEAANLVSEMLRGQDFYQPSHETIFDTIVELNGRAEPADAITVAGELKRAGVLSKAGGAAYLHTLIASVPTAAHAAYSARTVRERAIMRRPVTPGRASSSSATRTPAATSTRSSTRPRPRSTPSPTGAKPPTTCP